MSPHISCIEIHNNTHWKDLCWGAQEEKRDKRKQMTLAVPCWLRRFWETDNLFSCEEMIKRKKNAVRALLSIHLFISLSSPLLDPLLHIPHVLPHSLLAVHHIPMSNYILIAFLLFCLPIALIFSFLHHLLSHHLIQQAPGLLCLSVGFLTHSIFPLSSYLPPAIPTGFLLSLLVGHEVSLYAMASDWLWNTPVSVVLTMSGS